MNYAIYCVKDWLAKNWSCSLLLTVVFVAGFASAIV